jgi:hypothetical protein
MTRFGDPTFPEALGKEILAAFDANKSGTLEPEELPNGGTFEEFRASLDRRFTEVRDSLGEAQARGVIDNEVSSLRTMRVEKSIERVVRALDLDKNSELDAAESRSLSATLAKFPSLSRLDFAAIDAVAGPGDGRLSVSEIQEAVIVTAITAIEEANAASAVAATTPRAALRGAAPEPRRARPDEREPAGIAERLALVAKRSQEAGSSEAEILRELSDLLERIHAGLDANADGGLDAAESGELLAALATSCRHSPLGSGSCRPLQFRRCTLADV